MTRPNLDTLGPDTLGPDTPRLRGGPSSAAERILAGCPGLRTHPRGASIAAIAGAALDAVDPRAQIANHTHALAKPKGHAAVIGEFVFDLADDPDAPGTAEHGRVWVFGAGKASVAMAAALVERFPEHIVGGLIIAKHRPSPELATALGPVGVTLGDHPTPGTQSEAAHKLLVRAATEVGPRDLVLCPISGGASALLSAPSNLSGADWALLIDHLLARDVSIQAINRLRRRLDALKAGGLARLFAPATVVGLIISDVIGDDLALVGSGPTVYADTHDGDECHAALLAELSPSLAGLPPHIIATLRSAPMPASVPINPGTGLPQGVHQVLVARNGDAREAACKRARVEGLDSVVLLPALGGPAADEGRRLAALLHDPPADLPVNAPFCLVMGGETTVTLPDQPGRGGRNLTLALAAMPGLAATVDTLDPTRGAGELALLTLASDGEDGPTDAAGALVTPTSMARAHAQGLDPERALAHCDSYPLFAALGDLVKTGPTGTNVCDLAFLFRW